VEAGTQEKTVDLNLSNVAVVEGFHANIVSEALLREKGLWFNGELRARTRSWQS
jgi:hypothetical protein